ncbi:tyrosine-type recombinase/integrase [Paenibacillus vini]|uniref:Tyrosine recombinase XerC n=1 Tax=Paenibacillus vini TaxID=1476024 RepID=A0ABQ4MFG9_9BACL|nr:tyrosine-type recombinase/integrase [Paenibacillus vini]GIP54736.1 tyrosine recombinase XerC [Paenibacillus vini]
MPLKKRERRVPNGARTIQEFPRITFEQALDFAVAAKKAEGLRERTLIDYAKNYGYFTDWVKKAHPDIEYVDEISPQIIRDHITYMKYDHIRYDGHRNIKTEDVGLSDTSVNIRLRTLKAIFNQLERDELIEDNPFAKVKLLRQDVDLTNCLTDDEVKAILAQPNRRDFVGFRDYVGIVTLLDSGCRVSELLGLRAGDIDFQTRFIVLSGEMNKNRKPRMVPISAHVAKLLLQLIEENKQFFSTDRIFMSSFGEPVNANNFNKRLKYYGAKAGISGKKMTAHVYRHTWARAMVLNGCDPFTIQKMGGWADMRTMRRYVQMDTSDLRRSHDEFSPTTRFIKKRY